VGYKYGHHQYSEHLYSRWPDLWEPKTCDNDAWSTVVCLPQVWFPPDVAPVPLQRWLAADARPTRGHRVVIPITGSPK
jgi:hypothetical protein